MRRGGFTLLELLIVVTIVGLVTSVAAVRFGTTHAKAAFEQSVGRFETLDARLRMHARRHGRPIQLELQLREGTVRRIDDNDARDQELHLGRRVSIERFLSSARSTSSGRVTLDFAPDGSSDSYAVHLAGPAELSTWLLVAGETGQVTRLKHEKDVEKILGTLRPDVD